MTVGTTVVTEVEIVLTDELEQAGGGGGGGGAAFEVVGLGEDLELVLTGTTVVVSTGFEDFWGQVEGGGGLTLSVSVTGQTVV